MLHLDKLIKIINIIYINIYMGTPVDINTLFIKYCPIFYFHKNEPYMPADFDDILKIAGLKPNIQDINKVNLINIDRKKRFDHPIGKQILCKTSGLITTGNNIFIDLIYVVTFTWNGTLEEHAFDKEEVTVRLVKIADGWDIKRVFGSAHGNGMWYDKKYLKMIGVKPVMYSANESHAMYNRPKVYKRIFGFGSDVTGESKKWEPTQFVIFNQLLSVNIIDINGNRITADPTVDFNYFLVNKEIGDNKNSQTWAGALSYDTLNLDAYYRYDGGIDNLFNGPDSKVNRVIRDVSITVCSIIWVAFLGYIIFKDVTNKQLTKKDLALFLPLHILLVGLLFLSGAIAGLNIFVLSPS